MFTKSSNNFYLIFGCLLLLLTSLPTNSSNAELGYQVTNDEGSYTIFTKVDKDIFLNLIGNNTIVTYGATEIENINRDWVVAESQNTVGFYKSVDLVPEGYYTTVKPVGLMNVKEKIEEFYK